MALYYCGKPKYGWIWWNFKILRLLDTHNGYKTSKYVSKLQIPYHHPLNQWLQGATNGKILSMHTSTHFCTPLHAPLGTPPCTHLCNPPCTSAHPFSHPCTLLHLFTLPHAPFHAHTSMHESHWSGVPTTANQIIGFDQPNYHKIPIFFSTTS